MVYTCHLPPSGRHAVWLSSSSLWHLQISCFSTEGSITFLSRQEHLEKRSTKSITLQSQIEHSQERLYFLRTSLSYGNLRALGAFRLPNASMPSRITRLIRTTTTAMDSLQAIPLRLARLNGSPSGFPMARHRVHFCISRLPLSFCSSARRVLSTPDHYFLVFSGCLWGGCRLCQRLCPHFVTPQIPCPRPRITGPAEGQRMEASS